MSKLNTYFQTFTTDALGQIFLTGIMNIADYSQVSVEIALDSAVPVTMKVTCYMGVITGQTLSEAVGHFALGTTARIHTFNVAGPEFNVVLTDGPPNTDVPIEAWVFLR